MSSLSFQKARDCKTNGKRLVLWKLLKVSALAKTKRNVNGQMRDIELHNMQTNSG